MNTEAYLPWRFSPSTTCRTVAVTALLCTAPVSVIADTQPAPVRETRVAKVSLADLDVSTPEGLRVAHERLHRTARHLCSQLADMRSIAHQPEFVRCVDEALANALRQIKEPALASLPESHPPR